MTGMRKMNPTWWACAVVALALPGCISVEVRSAFGPGVNYFNFGSSFAWWPNAVEEGIGTHAANPTFDAFLRDTITKAFQARGYALMDENTPDFLIDYAVVRKTLGGLRHVQWTSVHEEGSLIIDVLDAQTHKHVWRGCATARINEAAAPADQRMRVTEVVRQILERFPKEGTQ